MNDWVRSKPLLALLGVISAGMSLLSVFGLLSALGVRAVPQVGLVPFLILGEYRFVILFGSSVRAPLSLVSVFGLLYVLGVRGLSLKLCPLLILVEYYFLILLVIGSSALPAFPSKTLTTWLCDVYPKRRSTERCYRAGS